MSPVERSDKFVTVGYFLAACSDPSDGFPPAELSVPDWNHAYAAFYRALGAGRALRSFSNSLKATRDTFDGWVDSARAGWRNPENRDEPKPLQAIELATFHRWRDEPRASLWKYVRDFADQEVGQVPGSVLADIESSEDPEGKKRTEGGRKVVVSSRVERDPSLRAEALRLHGHDCMVCDFNSSLRTATGAVISPRFTTWNSSLSGPKPTSRIPKQTLPFSAPTVIAWSIASARRFLISTS